MFTDTFKLPSEPMTGPVGGTAQMSGFRTMKAYQSCAKNRR